MVFTQWFLHKANGKHFHLILFICKAINIENFTIKSSYAEVLLGVTFDSNLSFREHVRIFATANGKLHALSRVCKYISHRKCRMLMKSLIISQFSYYPLIWMTHTLINNKIKHTHERALRIVYRDFSTSFEG